MKDQVNQGPGEPANQRTKTKQPSKYETNRPTAHQRGYGSKWQTARKQFLINNPLCAFHLEQGQYVPATVVDHIEPHKGDMVLFWDQTKWQSLCKPCHDSIKQRLERAANSGDQTPGQRIKG